MWVHMTVQQLTIVSTHDIQPIVSGSTVLLVYMQYICKHFTDILSFF